MLRYTSGMAGNRSDLERALFGISRIDELMGRSALDVIRRDLGMSIGKAEVGSALDVARASVLNIERLGLGATMDRFQGLARNDLGVGKIIRDLAEQQRRMSGIIDRVGGIGELDRLRIGNWAAALQGPKVADMSIIGSGFAEIAADLARARGRLGDFGAAVGTSQLGKTLASIGLPDDVRSAIAGTSLKMSVIAGVGDMRGIDGSSYDEAVRSLMGGWRTRPDLPPSFWRDRRVRERHYRRAEVDSGLVAAPPLVAVEVMIESGLAAGGRDEDGAVALFSFGGVSVSIRATDAQIDAYRGVLAFERRLREFLAEKLLAHAGPKWFKQRVDQGVFAKAKGVRESALKSGEQSSALINYTELGELKDVILRKDNWEQVFEVIFVNRQRFDHDMLTLMAVRRPAAHARMVDSTQMLEALLVMKRLDDRMSDDGGWSLAAASDE